MQEDKIRGAFVPTLEEAVPQKSVLSERSVQCPNHQGYYRPRVLTHPHLGEQCWAVVVLINQLDPHPRQSCSKKKYCARTVVLPLETFSSPRPDHGAANGKSGPTLHRLIGSRPPLLQSVWVFVPRTFADTQTRVAPTSRPVLISLEAPSWHRHRHGDIVVDIPALPVGKFVTFQRRIVRQYRDWSVRWHEPRVGNCVEGQELQRSDKRFVWPYARYDSNTLRNRPPKLVVFLKRGTKLRLPSVRTLGSGLPYNRERGEERSKIQTGIRFVASWV